MLLLLYSFLKTRQFFTPQLREAAVRDVRGKRRGLRGGIMHGPPPLSDVQVPVESDLESRYRGAGRESKNPGELGSCGERG